MTMIKVQAIIGFILTCFACIYIVTAISTGFVDFSRSNIYVSLAIIIIALVSNILLLKARKLSPSIVSVVLIISMATSVVILIPIVYAAFDLGRS